MDMPTEPPNIDKLTNAWRWYIRDLQNTVARLHEAHSVAINQPEYEHSSSFYVPRGHGVWQTPIPLPKYSDVAVQPQGDADGEIIMRDGPTSHPGYVEITCTDGQLSILPRFPNTMLVKRYGLFEQP